MQKHLQELTAKGADLRDYMVVDCDEDTRSAVIVSIDDFASNIVDNIGWTDK